MPSWKSGLRWPVWCSEWSGLHSVLGKFQHVWEVVQGRQQLLRGAYEAKNQLVLTNPEQREYVQEILVGKSA
jgi:hypothetical protein